MTLAALILAASTLVTPPAPGGAADGETSTNAVLSLRPDGNVFRLTFAAWAEDPPRCLFDPDWTHAKVFVRGEGPSDGRIALRRFNQGTVLIVR